MQYVALLDARVERTQQAGLPGMMASVFCITMYLSGMTSFSLERLADNP
jgi:hypothetical protein